MNQRQYPGQRPQKVLSSIEASSSGGNPALARHSAHGRRGLAETETRVSFVFKG